MEWRKWYLDAVLVPCALLVMFSYHIYLWYKVRTEPFSTIVGTNSRARRSWVAAIMKVYLILVFKACDVVDIYIVLSFLSKVDVYS